ncbi:MAG: hypothetical protein RRC34_13210 [Lentisphaeria bacterium]|nr:hypothetical protein [Lentisphaeria bacterium]
MKSAFELAMEKYDEDPVEALTPEQKEQLAEIDRKFDAKIAAAKIRTEPKILTLSRDEASQLRAELAVELAGYNDARERQKEKLRAGFTHPGGA